MPKTYTMILDERGAMMESILIAENDKLKLDKIAKDVSKYPMTYDMIVGYLVRQYEEGKDIIGESDDTKTA
ncbi:hypothetical protein LCGC14_2527650 [marine sediment metagenome]|uniref:Uncharacterized protein n=1 Tax=marine sediment metagenome TaxID=412755 RepID=A0A0F9BHF2_9ZZZZ